MITIAGIERDTQFSPNHIGNDAAIFKLTADNLLQAGFNVNIYSEEELIAGKVTEPCLFNMARSVAAVKQLQHLEENGHIVINSGFGIENCTRERMTTLLMQAKIPHPESIIVETDQIIGTQLETLNLLPCWIKRGDFHTIHKEDVSYVRNREEAQELLHEYRLRGIKRAIINRHLIGDLIKFYGVKDTPFFYWFYPTLQQHTKWGLEAINGDSKGIVFNSDKLHKICTKAADILGIEIYGGDCIIDDQGNARIIDFNDFPSFAPCREIAALYIAKKIIANINPEKHNTPNHDNKDNSNKQNL